ncbi:MAG: hypothetical protein RIS35_161 [Pseudomonadota bacterium]|jgi:threonine/homoserine/homoserine lactone efflux protein
MFGIHDLPLFPGSGLLPNLTPGADTPYIVTRSMTLGLRAGIVAALGIGAGCVVHAFLPQFVDSASTTKSAAMLLLGAIFVFNGTLWCLFVAWAAARLGRGGPGRQASAWAQRGVGGLFVLFGSSLLLSGRDADPSHSAGVSR